MKLKLPHQRFLLALGLLLSVAMVYRATVRDRGVIIDHIEFGRRVVAGETPYDTFVTERRNEGPLHTPYPPSYGLWTAPFSLVPESVARFLWATLSVLALWSLGWCVLIWLRTVAPQLVPRFPALALFALVLTSRYWLRDLHGGGGNLLNVALAFGALTLAERGRPVTAGLALALSVLSKPTQLLFLPLLLLFGRWRAAVATVAFTGAGTLLTAALLDFDAQPWQQWFEGSLAYGSMVDIYAEPAGGFPPFTWMNQCLRCAVHRYVGTVPAEFQAEVQGFFPGIGLAAETVHHLVRAASAALVLAPFLLAWSIRHSTEGRLLAASALLVVSLLVSPISWKAHHVALFAPLLVILARADAKTWTWLLVYLPTCVMGEAILGKDLKNTMQSLYLVTGWNFVFLALLVRRMSAVAREGSSSPGGTP